MEQVQDIRPVLRRMVRRLVDAYDPACVILFGSQAWGTPHPRHSDVDLFIVKEISERMPDCVATVQRILEQVPDTPPIDVFLLTPQETERRLVRGDQFVAGILTKGNVLYVSNDGILRSLREKLQAMPSPEDAEYPLDWIRNADKDWQRAHMLLDASDPEMAGFCLQQAVEKCLKAFLLRRGWELRKTHNLKELLEDATDYAPFLAPYREVCECIAKYYFAERYPAAPGEERPSVDMSEEAVRAAMEEVEPLTVQLRQAVIGD